MHRPICSTAIGLFITVASFADRAQAADISWDANGANPPNGNFNVANNWEPNAVPGDADSAILRLGSATAYTATFPGNSIFEPIANYTSGNLRIGSNTVAFAQSSGFNRGPSTYTLTNPTTAEAGRGIIIGELSGDNAVLSTALAVTGAAVTIGDAAGSQGTLNVNAGTFNVAGSNASDFELIIGNSGTGTLNVATQLNMASPSGNMVLGLKPGSTGTATVSGPNARASAGTSIVVGAGGTGTLTVENAGVVEGASAMIGNAAGSNGTLIIQNGGSVTANEARLANSAGSTGTLNVDAGTLNLTASGTPALIVGEGGSGFLNITRGGQVTQHSPGILGSASGSIGTAIVDGSGSRWTSENVLRVGGGLGSTGTLNVTNGGQVSSLAVRIGDGFAAQGTVNVSGSGSTLISFGLSVGNNGPGALNITSEGSVMSRSFRVSIGAPDATGLDPYHSVVTVDGPGSTWTIDTELRLGDNFDSGALNIRNGGRVSSRSTIIGVSNPLTTSKTAVHVDGSGSRWTSTAVVIGTGTGELRVSGGGAVVATESIEIALFAGAAGTMLVQDSGSTVSTPELYVGGSINTAGGTGRLIIDGGTVAASNLKVWAGGEVNVNGGTLDVAGTLTTVDDSVLSLDGGTLRIRSLAALAAFPHTFDWTGGTLHLIESGLTVGTAGPLGKHLVLNSRMNLQLAGALQVDAGAQLVGAGGVISAAGGGNAGAISIVGGSLSYSQPVVNNGNLDAIRATLTFPGDGIKNNIGLTNNSVLTLANVTVNGDVHSPTGSTINVAAGVVFNGFVSGGANFPGAGTVTFNGGFSPGDSPAGVSFGGGIELGPGGALEIELGGTTAGTEHDQLHVGGLLSLDGALDVLLLNGFQAAIGDRFDLFDYLALDGRFDAIKLPPLPAGQFWDTAELYTSGTISISAIPEPAAVCIWITASICVGAVVLRRRHGCREQRC